MFVFQTFQAQKAREAAFEGQVISHALTPAERAKIASSVEFMLQKIHGVQ
jgi:hypothetical protein